MARGFSAKFHRNIKRLDIKGQFWTRKDAETTFHMLKTFNGLTSVFDCIIDITNCDIDAIRLERFIEVALEKGLRYIVIVKGDYVTKDWMRDGYPIEKKQRFSQAESYIESCIVARELAEKKAKRKAKEREKKMARINTSNLNGNLSSLPVVEGREIT